MFLALKKSMGFIAVFLVIVDRTMGKSFWNFGLQDY